MSEKDLKNEKDLNANKDNRIAGESVALSGEDKLGKASDADGLGKAGESVALSGEDKLGKASEGNGEGDLFNLIINTAVRTAFFVTAVLSLVSALLVSLFPLKAASTYYNLGMVARAFQCLEKHYNRGISQEDELKIYNALSELGIELLYDRIDRGRNTNYYADRVIEYGNSFLTTPSSDIFSADTDILYVNSEVDFTKHPSLVNHRAHIANGVLSAYVSFGRNSENRFVYANEIDWHINYYFWTQFGFMLNLNEAQNTITRILPNWSVGVYLNDSFRQMGLKALHSMPAGLEYIEVDIYRELYFDRLYSLSGGYTELYDRCKSTFISVRTMLGAINYHSASKEVLLSALSYYAWAKAVATDLFLMNSIIIAQGREYYIGDPLRARIRSEMDYFEQQLRLLMSQYDFVMAIYGNATANG